MYIESDNELSKISFICELLFKDYNESLKNLLLLFLNEEQFKNILKSKIRDKNYVIKKSYIPGNYILIENFNNNKKLTATIGVNFVSIERKTFVNKKVRNLGEISFRILNFILYSHLFLLIV